jgi:hypothetical protein
VRPARSFALIVVGMVVLTACRIDTTVSVRVRDDGSGTVVARVVLDAAAVRAAEARGVTLEQRVRVDDLPATGWKVAPWSRRDDGSAALVIRKPFASPAQLTIVMAELNGSSGPLRAVRLRRSTDPLRTTFDFRARADLAGVESGVAGDEQLAANLSAQRVDVAGLDASLTTRLRESLRMRVAVALPGADTRVWRLAPGTRTVLTTSSSELAVARIVWLATGILLAVVAIAVVVVGARRDRRVRRPRPPDAGVR